MSGPGAEAGRLLRVGVLGAAGRMGQAVCAAVEAAPDLELVAAQPLAILGLVVGLMALKTLAMYAAGRIKPATEARFPLEEAAQAHARLESGDNIGKILLLP